MSMKLRFHSVGAKLLLLFVVCIVLSVSTVGLTSYGKARSLLIEEAGKASAHTISEAAGKIDFQLSQLQSYAKEFISDKDIQTSLNTIDQSAGNKMIVQEQEIKLRKKLDTILNTRSLVDSIYLIPAVEGRPAISSNQTIPDRTPSDTPWFRDSVKADGQMVWQSASKGGLLGGDDGLYFSYSRLYVNPLTQAKEYVLAFQFRENVLRSLFDQIRLSDHSRIYIVDASNHIAGSTDPSEVGTEFPIRQEVLSGRAEPSDTQAVHADDQIIVYKPLTTSGWTLVGVAPASDFTGSAASIFRITLAMIAVSLVFAAGIGYLILRFIGRPLAGLTKLMQEGAGGNLNVRTSDTASKDEIGQLGEAFNRMMDHITVLVRQANESARKVLSTARELSESARITSEAVEEMSASAEQISVGANVLAEEAENGNGLAASASGQMEEAIRLNGCMDQAAGEVAAICAAGTSYMADLDLQTQAASGMTRSMAERIGQLQQSAASIRTILELLNGMNKQTNILSLNASIEAVRAGNAGKGFMVVAEEIRKLAEQSKRNIEVVGEMTDKIHAEMDGTVELLREAEPIFQRQIGSVREAESIFADVQSRMAAFTERLLEVGGSIHRIKQSQLSITETMSSVSSIAQESSAGSQEVASLGNQQLQVSQRLVELSGELEGLSLELHASLSRFTY